MFHFRAQLQWLQTQNLVVLPSIYRLSPVVLFVELAMLRHPQKAQFNVVLQQLVGTLHCLVHIRLVYN